MSYLNYPKKYPTLLKYKEAQNEFNEKLSYYLSLEDKYNKLVEKQITQSTWSSVSGSLNDVFANGDNNIWGYNINNQVFTCEKPCLDGNWKITDGKIKDSTGDAENIYGLGMNNKIYKKKENNESKWRSMKTPKFDKISSNFSSSIIASKNNIKVSLRITIGCSGGKKIHVSKICFQYKDENINCKNVNEHLKNNKITFNTSFNTTKTMLDNIVITINNSKSSNKHYSSITYLKIETMQEDQNYLTIYESNLNMETESGLRNYNVSLGNGLNVGYKLFQCVKPCDTNDWKPISVDKDIVDISSDESYIYMTDTDDILWRCPGGCSTGNWERDPIGNAKKVDASGSKFLRVIGSDNMLWERDKRKWGQEWNPTNKVVKNTSMSSSNNNFLTSEDIEGTLWTITPNDNIEVGISPPLQKWRTVKGMDATIGLENANKKSTDDWDFIGEYNNYNGCKFASLNAKKPYNKITYFNDTYNKPNLKNTCWGNKIGKKYGNKQDPNTTTGYPPYGYTKLGGLKGIILLREMKKLNTELIIRAKELKRITLPINALNQTMLKQRTAISKKMENYVKNLENDRSNIRLLEKQNLELDSEKENSNLILVQKQGAYIGISVALIILLFITAKQLKK